MREQTPKTEKKMVEEKQTSLEAQLRDLSANFNHQDKAYLLLSRAAKKGVLPEIEKQLAILQEKVGKTTDNEKVPRKLSVQLLIDYLESGHNLYQLKLAPSILNPIKYSRQDLRYPVNTNGIVTRPSLDYYDSYKESEKSD